MELNELFTKAKMNEMGLIGACLLNEHQIVYVASNLDPKWFLNEDTRKAAELIIEAGTQQKILRDMLIDAKLTRLAATCIDKAYGMSHQIDEGIKKSKEHYASYQLTLLVKDADPGKPEKEIGRLMTGLQNIMSSSEGESSDAKYLLKIYEEAQEEQTQKLLSGKELIGHSCGIPKIDEIIDGIRKEHFWVVGGYSSMGKTFFALNFVKALLEQNVKVGIFSLEMSKQDILGRIFSIKTGIPSIKLLKGSLDEDSRKSFEEAKDLIKDKLHVYSEKSSLNEIMAAMNLLKIKENVEVFVLDYAQLVQDGNSSEYETLRKTSALLQAFCRKSGVSVIMLSQISNESAKNPNSFVMGFKGSGAIGASADLAIELSPNESREEREEKIINKKPFSVLCSVKKNRHGPIRDIELKFTTYCGRFEEDDGFSAM